eukprot:Nk52_evm24s277 gene=Nk52_evmTU24s277
MSRKANPTLYPAAVALILAASAICASAELACPSTSDTTYRMAPPGWPIIKKTIAKLCGSAGEADGKRMFSVPSCENFLSSSIKEALSCPAEVEMTRTFFWQKCTCKVVPKGNWGALAKKGKDVAEDFVLYPTNYLPIIVDGAEFIKDLACGLARELGEHGNCTKSILDGDTKPNFSDIVHVTDDFVSLDGSAQVQSTVQIIPWVKSEYN